MSPRKSYVSLRKRSPRICFPRSESFSAVLFSTATANFPIWASAVKTGRISSPPGFACLPRCLCLTTVSRSSFKLWPPNLPGLSFTRLSILAASLRITHSKSRDVFPLELLIFFYLVSPPEFFALVYGRSSRPVSLPTPSLKSVSFFSLVSFVLPLVGKEHCCFSPNPKTWVWSNNYKNYLLQSLLLCWTTGYFYPRKLY